ncbi:hypothetical protein EUTSA_v10026096mg [Eutrema salsugineum]|uniref:Uncharacterized protein n=2 Tax=Eutrema salsugineum TaxID=72664 RepID=V4P6N6_EUTSA|nr:hypothetical protein EUTSA_v10026096mg [Eutrema salsugineum]
MEENVENSSAISFSSHHPLFSCFITLYSLILIYFSHDSLLRFLLSPVLLISVALLASLLRLGSTRESNTRPEKSNEGETRTVNLEKTGKSKALVRDSSSETKHETDSDTKPDFVEWDFRAPLEVIHEEDDDDDDDEEEEENPSVTRLREIERFPSLSLCYPESDSESDSDSSSEFNFPEIGNWISPEKVGFRWEEEDGDGIGDDGLIEIKLGEYNRSHEKMSKRDQTELDFHAEEDGLIEIDLFP